MVEESEAVSIRKTILVVFLAAVLAVGCSDEFGNRLSGFDTDDGQGSTNDILSGRAFLGGQADHSHIRSYPFFHTAEQTFSVSRGLPKEPLDDMLLSPAVQFTVTTNGTFFSRGSIVVITLAAENVSTKPALLSSTTGPMAAFSIRRDGESMAGGLFPGEDQTQVDVTLDPGETKYFELRWEIKETDIVSGQYEIFAVLTTNGTHPEYFDPSGEPSLEFNESLYDKLNPAGIRID